jgi:hypothetical protein
MRYDFDYIEFYYRKVFEKDSKGTVKDFAGFLYKAMIEEKYKYYEFKEKKKRREGEKIAKEKTEREEEMEKKKKREQEKGNDKRWIDMFDLLDKEEKKMYIEKLYAMNDIYKELDKESISNATKFAIGAMIDRERNQ